MTKPAQMKTYRFCDDTTVRLDKGVYGLMSDDDTTPSLLAWPLDPALGSPQDLLARDGDMTLRPALCAVPGHASVFAAVYDPCARTLRVDIRPHGEPLIASGAALALASTLSRETRLSDILPMLDALDETLPQKAPRRDRLYEDG